MKNYFFAFLLLTGFFSSHLSRAENFEFSYPQDLPIPFTFSVGEKISFCGWVELWNGFDKLCSGPFVISRVFASENNYEITDGRTSLKVSIGNLGKIFAQVPQHFGGWKIGGQVQSCPYRKKCHFEIIENIAVTTSGGTYVKFQGHSAWIENYWVQDVRYLAEHLEATDRLDKK